MRIKVNNYGIVRDADIEFLSGLNVIRGESGSGKSTVIRGIEGAIFNTSGDAVITQGESCATIEIEYSGHKLKRTRNTKTSFKTAYEVDGDRLQKVGQTPVQKVLDAFGIKEIKAGGASLRPNFLPQFAKPFLIDESPSKIFEFLTVTQNAVNLKDVESAISDDLKELQTQRKIKEETVNSLKKMILTSSQILEHDKEISKLSDDLDKFNKKEDCTNRLENLLKSISEKKEAVDSMHKKIKAIESVLSSIEQLDINYEKLNEYIRKISSIENTIKKISSLKETSDSLYVIIERAKSYCISEEKKTKVSALIEKYSQLDSCLSNINQKRIAFDKINSDGKELKKEKLRLDKEIKAFYADNIPIVIMNTNDELCESLNVTKHEVVDVLNTKWIAEC